MRWCVILIWYIWIYEVAHVTLVHRSHDDICLQEAAEPPISAEDAEKAAKEKAEAEAKLKSELGVTILWNYQKFLSHGCALCLNMDVCMCRISRLRVVIIKFRCTSLKLESSRYVICAYCYWYMLLISMKGKDVNGLSDPIVYIEMFGQTQNSSVKKASLNTIFDELFIFNFRNLDKDAFSEGIIRIKVCWNEWMVSLYYYPPSIFFCFLLGDEC